MKYDSLRLVWPNRSTGWLMILCQIGSAAVPVAGLWAAAHTSEAVDVRATENREPHSTDFPLHVIVPALAGESLAGAYRMTRHLGLTLDARTSDGKPAPRMLAEMIPWQVQHQAIREGTKVDRRTRLVVVVAFPSVANFY